jgi:two-component system LytT family response regulator
MQTAIKVESSRTSIYSVPQSTILKNLVTPYTDRIAISIQEGREIIKFSDILYCHAMSNYCKIEMINGKSILASKTLKYISDYLPKDQFIRAHNSYLINANQVQRYGLDIELSDGSIIPISRRLKKEVYTWLEQKIVLV